MLPIRKSPRLDGTANKEPVVPAYNEEQHDVAVMNAIVYKWNDMEFLSSLVKSPKSRKGKHKQSPLKVKPLMMKAPIK